MSLHESLKSNPLLSHTDLLTFTLDFLEPLVPHLTPCRSRLRLPNPTGTHFDPAAAELEGYARPLWAIGSLASLSRNMSESPSSIPEHIASRIEALVFTWRRGLAAGTDPAHEEYWGAIRDTDQRMVECEIIAFAMLADPRTFYHDFPEDVRSNIRTWLQGIREKSMPPTNWRWFRVLTLLALLRVCGVPEDEVVEEMRVDLQILDGFVLGDGWSSDGPWRANGSDEEELGYSGGLGRQADYYSGSFAIQFSQLLFCRFAEGIKGMEDRRQKYFQGAKRFGAGFWRYFDKHGAVIPFGRSLTYRFACGGFFSALAFAQVPNMPEPLARPGQVKGFLLRHLRWWAAHSNHIFNLNGTLNIGWLYPNTFMAEDYNSPQSPYWCTKTLIALLLPPSSPIWHTREEPFPALQLLSTSSSPSSFPAIHTIPSPSQILCSHPSSSHHFLLSTSQHCPWPLRASSAKYTKFAYSSTFGFSVPTGPYITQLAPDSTLTLSRDAGETWALKGARERSVLGTAIVCGQEVPALESVWWPWRDGLVRVRTTLIPPADALPDWHFRIHRIRIADNARLHEGIKTVEGGFTIKRRFAKGSIDNEECHADNKASDREALAVSEVGVSAVADFSAGVKRNGSIMKPDANTNLMWPRTWIPILERDIAGDAEEVVLVTGVFAVTNMRDWIGRYVKNRIRVDVTEKEMSVNVLV